MKKLLKLLLFIAILLGLYLVGFFIHFQSIEPIYCPGTWE